MSYRRQSQDEGWQRWLRENRAELIACGVPPEAYHSELDWFLFLDHGYVQSIELHISQWWTIKLLNSAQANSLRNFLVREYGTRYEDLVRSLESSAE